MSYRLACKVCKGVFESQFPHAVYCRDSCRKAAAAVFTLSKYYADHERSKQEQIEKRRARILRRWSIILEKFGDRCARCKGTYPIVVYDLHHPNGKKSRRDTPTIVIANRSENTFLKMLDEVVLMCANCHRLHHAESGDWAPMKGKS